MRGLLHRPGDEPSPDEEKALSLMKAREIQRLDEIDGRLTRSAARSVEYAALVQVNPSSTKVGDRARRDLVLERLAQDRMLDERRMVMGLLGRHG